MKVTEESEKVGLKLNIQRMKIMTSVPITSWQIDGETMGTVTDVKDVKTLVVYDVEWEKSMDSMKGKCAMFQHTVSTWCLLNGELAEEDGSGNQKNEHKDTELTIIM